MGTYVLPEVFPELGDIFAKSAQVIHIDLNAYEIAKNHRVDQGVVADPKLTLALLAEALAAVMTAQQKKAAAARTQELGAAKAAKRAAAIEADRAAERDTEPLKMARFMAELAAQLPKQDVIIFDEALTNSPPVVRYWPPQRTGEYFLTRGGSLGVGIPGAIGAKLANPDKTVIGFTGDGGAMYTIQALVDGGAPQCDAKFVICNNASYRLLQLNIDQYWKERDIPNMTTRLASTFLIRRCAS